MLTLALVLVWAWPVVGAETGGRARIQLGQEYDTNAERVYSPTVSAPLARIVLEGQLRCLWQRHRLRLDYHGGFKAFYSHTSENLIVTRLVGEYAWIAPVGWVLGTRLKLHDASMKVHDRDYRLFDGAFFARKRLLNWLLLELFVGGRYYYFKPDDHMDYGLKLSHAGPVGGVHLYIRNGEDISATILYQAGFRFYWDPAQMLKAGAVVESQTDRFDIQHMGGVEIRHRIRYFDELHLIIKMSYLVFVNDTNSYGSAAHWHRLRLVLSAQLPWRFTLHFMGTLQFTGYRDGIYVEGDLYEPEADENENSLVLRLSRPIWKGLSVFVHGAIYRNDFKSTELMVPAFERETIMAGVAYDVDF